MGPGAHLSQGRATGTHGPQRPPVVKGSEQTWAARQVGEEGGSCPARLPGQQDAGPALTPGAALPHWPGLFCFGHATRYAGSYFPDQGSNLCPLQWKYGVLTTGPPGKSHGQVFFIGPTHHPWDS